MFAWLGHQFLPSIFPDRIPLVNYKMVYLPAWSVAAKVTTKVTVSKDAGFEEVQAIEGGKLGDGLQEASRVQKEMKGTKKKGGGGKRRTMQVGLDSEFSFFPG